MAKVLMVLADGVEEMEAVIVADVLRRAGLEVTLAATGRTCEVTASRGVRLVADMLLDAVQPSAFDALVIPGGANGVNRLKADPRVLDLIRERTAAHKLVAAVCAGPLVLQAAGVLHGVRVTSHPSVRQQLAGVAVCDDRVVEDGLFITSQGPGTSMEFALAVVCRLVGAGTARTVAAGLILPAGSALPAM